VREVLYVLIRTQEKNVDIYDKFHTTTRNRICFEDGVLDFKTKTFYDWNEVENKDTGFEYYSTVMIHRPFKAYFKSPNKTVINDIKNKLFVPLFGNDTTKALNFISRGLSGHYEDKNWATYLGNRDSGKGVFYDGIECAFDAYVKTFELGNLMYERNTDTSETARKMYWLMDYEFVRLGISQETPAPEEKLRVRGKLLKKLAGGGDTHVARRNYDRTDTHFKIDTTFMFMGNNELVVDVNDVYEHHIAFHSVCQFKSQEEIDLMRENGENELILQSYNVKDPTIKDKCSTDEWKNAIVYLIYENFIDKPVATLKINNEEDDAAVLPIKKQILMNYEITRNDKDYVLCTDVYKKINNCKKKIDNELENIGIKKKKSKKTDITRDKNIYYGLKEIANNIPDSDIEPTAVDVKVVLGNEQESKNDDDEELEEKYFNGKKYYVSNKLVYDVDEDDNPDIEVGKIINGNINLY
jgi:hypothetical protein